MGWTESAGLAGLDDRERARLDGLRPMRIDKGTLIFRPGDPAQGFVVVLSGRIEVYLTGVSGREILLYAVEPGQSCVQTTLGLLGGEDYAGEAVTATECTVVSIPKPLFLTLMDGSPAFRNFVFAAFASRIQDVMHLLERVAFQRVEARLADALLLLEAEGAVRATHADLATRIGSAREVVSRRLDSFARRGWVETERGIVRLKDTAALRRLAATVSVV